jgi:hypothetical protein
MNRPLAKRRSRNATNMTVAFPVSDAATIPLSSPEPSWSSAARRAFPAQDEYASIVLSDDAALGASA